MQDQVSLLANDWEGCLNMVGAEPDSKKLHEFLGYLVPRLERMQRRFNWVKLRNIDQGKIWQINNYDFKMFKYMTSKYPDAVLVTNYSLTIADGDLTDVDRDLLLKQL